LVIGEKKQADAAGPHLGDRGDRSRHGSCANPDNAVQIDDQPVKVKIRRSIASLERFDGVGIHGPRLENQITSSGRCADFPVWEISSVPPARWRLPTG